MRLFDAIKASPVQAASRMLGDFQGDPRGGRQPNIAMLDDGKPKAFRAIENYGWERRPLREAKALSDWEPAASRRLPPDIPDDDDDGCSCGHTKEVV